MSNPKEQPQASEQDKASAQDQAPAKGGKVRVLSEAKRDGKTVRVLTDDVKVWKETSK